MIQEHAILYNEISKLPIEKIGKAISFIRFLEQEPDIILHIDEDEEKELHELLNCGQFVSSESLHAKIMELPND